MKIREREEEISQLRKHLAEFSMKVGKKHCSQFSIYFLIEPGLYLYIYLFMYLIFLIGITNSQREICPGEAYILYASGEH